MTSGAGSVRTRVLGAALATCALAVAVFATVAGADPSATGGLAVKMRGPAAGVVVSAPAGIGCRAAGAASCRHQFRAGVKIALAARAHIGYVGTWSCPPGTAVRRTDQPKGAGCKVTIPAGRTLTIVITWSKLKGTPGGTGSTTGVKLKGFAATPVQTGQPGPLPVPATLTPSGGTISSCGGATATGGAALSIVTTYTGAQGSLLATLTGPTGLVYRLRLGTTAAPAVATVAAEGTGPPVITKNGLYKFGSVQLVTGAKTTKLALSGSITISCL